jgi:hypothetical protein
MTPEEAAKATATGISGIGSRFMLDPATYQRGGELGFEGLEFYVGGRGGPLGETDGDVVAAAFVFFEPNHVRSQWDAAGTKAPRATAAEEFMACGHSWAEQRVPDDLDVDRLVELSTKAVMTASCAGAPLFAALRRMPAPAAPKPLALHQLNLLRELRGARHGAAVLAAGLSPLEAVATNAPYMAALFGWQGELPAVDDDLRAKWAEADAGTNRAMAGAFVELEAAERQELAELIQALEAATS